MDLSKTARRRSAIPTRHWSVGIRLVATALLLSSCANYIAVRRQAGPDDDISYSLGTLPLFGEEQVYDDLCRPPRQLAARWSSALAQSRILGAQQAGEFHRAICERDASGILNLAKALSAAQRNALRQALHEVDPFYTCEEVKRLSPGAKWAILAAILVVAGLAISAERTGFLEAGGGRYQNRRRALGSGGSAPPPPPPELPGGGPI